MKLATIIFVLVAARVWGIVTLTPRCVLRGVTGREYVLPMACPQVFEK